MSKIMLILLVIRGNVYLINGTNSMVNYVILFITMYPYSTKNATVLYVDCFRLVFIRVNS